MQTDSALSEKRRKAVLEFFSFIAEGKFKEGLHLFSPNCKTHNPYVAGDMDKLTDAMIQARKAMTVPQSNFSVKRIIVDEDFVAVHTELLEEKSQPSRGGLRQVHLFRFEGDRIVEYWDISQMVTPDMPNAAGAFG